MLKTKSHNVGRGGREHNKDQKVVEPSQPLVPPEVGSIDLASVVSDFAVTGTGTGNTEQQYVTLASTAYKFKRYGECLFAVSQV